MQPNKLPVHERVLIDMDHLLAARIAPGEFDGQVMEAILQNLITSVQEAAMPYAITSTRHEIVHDSETKQRTFRWLGRTAVQVAMSGYSYHHHPNAIRRVDIEVDEARYASESLRPGRVQVFISPRMSPADATLKEAQREHLGDDDAVRVSWIDDSPGAEPQRVMQSLLVRDVPLSAWVNMLADPKNIFGRSIAVDSANSALSVMAVHRELEIDREQLPDGPVTLLKEVVQYIDDLAIKQKVLNQIDRYYGDQELMHRQAEFKAKQWLDFECALAESMATGQATSNIKAFISTMQHAWNQQELRLLANHSLGEDLEFIMTRDLAAMLEKMKQNTLWGGAAVLHGNESVARQLDSATLAHVTQNEQVMFAAYQQGQDFRMLEANNARLIGGSNIKVGGGCAGTNNRNQSGDSLNPSDHLHQNQDESDQSDSNWESDPGSRKWKKGVCQVKSCSTRPGQTEVGPCSVCKSCQAKFDKGQDPTKEPARIQPKIQKAAQKTINLFEAKSNNFALAA